MTPTFSGKRSSWIEPSKHGKVRPGNVGVRSAASRIVPLTGSRGIRGVCTARKVARVQALDARHMRPQRFVPYEREHRDATRVSLSRAHDTLSPREVEIPFLPAPFSCKSQARGEPSSFCRDQDHWAADAGSHWPRLGARGLRAPRRGRRSTDSPHRARNSAMNAPSFAGSTATSANAIATDSAR